MKRVRKTISLTAAEFDHARARMIAEGWERDGDDRGISRYVQELIRKDMMAETQQHEARPSASKKKLHPRRN